MAEGALTADEVREILAARPEGILIGGQALAFWATYFRVEPPTALAAGITHDLDFLDTSAGATSFAERLSNTIESGQITLYRPSFDDPTPNSAKLHVRDFKGRAEPIEIDFLRAIFGFTAATESRLKARAVPVEVGTEQITIMHPLDVLASRVHNFALPAKRMSERAVAQTRLAINVAKAMIQILADECADLRQREALDATEEVATLAFSRSGIGLFSSHQIDLLAAVPVDAIKNAKFRGQRWPQICKEVERRRTRSR